MSLRRSTLTAYARAIERALSRTRGSPVVVSERDFALVRDWHARGIPLAAVLEALRSAQARGRAPRSLAYVAAAVEENWSAIAAGRAHDGGGASRVDETMADVWRKRRKELERDSPLFALLGRAIDRAERGDDPIDIDAMVDDALQAAAPPNVHDACVAAARRALARHRDRMAADVLERTLRRSVIDRLRDALGFPRLTGR